MSFLADVIAWFLDPTNWTGVNGILNRTLEHVQISAAATGLAIILALPPAVWLGHRRKGGQLVVAAVNIGRAVPSFAVLALAVPISIGLGLGISFWPTFLALLALAIPPIFTNSYTGVATVDPALVEAGRGMGMRDSQLLWRLEVPMASPVILAAIRVAAVQVVATATLGAIVAGGGLGRYIVDGFALQDSVQVFAGALLVGLLAVATEAGFGLLGRLTVPPTLRSRADEVEQHAT